MNETRCAAPENGSERWGNPGSAVTARVMIAIGALIALAVWGQYVADLDAAVFALDVAVGAVSVAVLPMVLRRPVAGGFALSVLAALSPVATPPATFAALYAARRRPFAQAAAVAVTGVAAHAVLGLWRPVGGLAYGWWLLLMIVAYAALVGWGALAQARHALLVSLRERARRAEAEQGRRVAEARVSERARIAREMHDVLAHRLSLLATYAGALEYRPDSSPEQLAAAAGVVRTSAHQALDELRDVISLLRDDEPGADSGAGGRPQPLLADLPALLSESRDAGMRVQLDNRVTEPPPPPDAVGRTAYRVVQEALTNARKHAAGQPVHVVVDGSPGTRLVIEVRNPLRDNRSGPPAGTPNGAGTGLIGLTERVHLAGGQLDHEITTAGEFRLRAWLPWPA
jgi:signal transduction histidine kinase